MELVGHLGRRQAHAVAPNHHRQLKVQPGCRVVCQVSAAAMDVLGVIASASFVSAVFVVAVVILLTILTVLTAVTTVIVTIEKTRHFSWPL